MAVAPADPRPATATPTGAGDAVGTPPTPDAGPSRRDLLVVAGVAVAVRLLAAVWLARAPQGLYDPTLYRGFARSIADGDGYASLLGRPTTYYPPGYPLFLGALQLLLDRVGLRDALPAGAAAVQALLGGVAAAATAVAGGRLGRSLPGRPTARSVAVAAGLVVALWPNLVAYSAVLLSETLFVALFALFLAAVMVMGREVRWGVPLVVAALALGAGTLVRPQVLLCLPAVALAWWLARVRWRALATGAAVLVAGVVVVVAPWTVRNAVVMGSPVPISTNGGDNLCIGFHRGATGGFAITDECATRGRYVDGPPVEVDRDRELQRRALRWALHHPSELPGLSARKVWLTYRDDRDALVAADSYGAAPRFGAGVGRVVGGVFDAAWWVLVASSVAGVVLLVRRPGRRDVGRLVVLLTAAAGVAVPVLFFGDPRFKMGLAPCVGLLAGTSLALGWAVVRPGGRGTDGSDGSDGVGGGAADGTGAGHGATA